MSRGRNPLLLLADDSSTEADPVEMFVPVHPSRVFTSLWHPIKKPDLLSYSLYACKITDVHTLEPHVYVNLMTP